MDTHEHETPIAEITDRPFRVLVDLHGTPLWNFISDYGLECYRAVLADCGDDPEVARECIETGFVFRAGSLAAYMEYALFDLWAGELDESSHPYLSEFIDYEGLAKARWEAGLVRIVHFEGDYYFFERSRGWIS